MNGSDCFRSVCLVQVSVGLSGLLTTRDVNFVDATYHAQIAG